MTDITPEEMHAIGMADPNSVPAIAEKLLPVASQEEATKLGFRSRTKLSRDDRKSMTVMLCTRAFEKVITGRAGVEKAIFGLTAREKAYVLRLVFEYEEWKADPGAYLAKLDEPAKG